MKTELISFIKYNHWANETLLNLIEKEVTKENLDQKIESSFPSIRKTFYHLWDAEYIWLRRLKGESLDHWPSKDFAGLFTEAKDGILKVDQEYFIYVNSLNEQDLQSIFAYKNVEGKTFSNPRWQSILHCMNHSTYHRGQVVTMLRQVGLKSIPATDFIAWCRLGQHLG